MTIPTRILVVEGDTLPPVPTAGKILFYAKTNGKFYSLNSLGQEREIGTGATGTGTVTSVAIEPNGQDSSMNTILLVFLTELITVS